MGRRFIFGDAGPRRHKLPWGEPAQDAERWRTRQFVGGTILALLGAMFALPIWIFLIHTPRFAHAAVAGACLPAVALVAVGIGIFKLIACLRAAPFDHLTAMSFGVLLIVGVLIVYAAVFVFALRFEAR